jgi:hypothetical protein
MYSGKVHIFGVEQDVFKLRPIFRVLELRHVLCINILRKEQKGLKWPTISPVQATSRYVPREKILMGTTWIPALR